MWDWAVLKGDVWQRHGQQVKAATPYLPGSFDRPPRNPAEKLNSGYKAWEYLTYVFGLGPALLRDVLPTKYWKNYCKLVYGVRLMHQWSIPASQICEAHDILTDFIEEFELLYFQHPVDRLHFVRQSIHAVGHIAHEVTRLGPAVYYTQWTMERTIGNLGEEIKQHSDPFTNLSARGVRRCQVNALKAMIPDLEPEPALPQGAEPLGDEYVMLRAADRTAQRVTNAEHEAFSTFMSSAGHDLGDTDLSVYRWARPRLPNGQIARSLWKEGLKALEHL